MKHNGKQPAGSLAVAGSMAVFLPVCVGLVVGLVGVGCSVGEGGHVLKPFSPPTPGETAREAFNVHDADIRRRSIMRLAAAPFGGEQPYLRLYRMLIDDPDASVRAACVRAIGIHGTPDDTPLITTELEHADAFVRWESVQALQKIHDPSAVGPLIKILHDDPDSDVRLAAAEALGQYAQVRVYQALVGALDDSSFGVVEAAGSALRTLTGYDFGYDSHLWMMWAQKQENDLFEQQRPYRWRPYVKPRGLLDKIMFWKQPRGVGPVVPKGFKLSNQAATQGSG